MPKGCPARDPPPPSHEMATAAVDTHPTGMHSCFAIYLKKNKVSLLLIILEVSIICPENYTLYNGRCYGVHNRELNFTDAESECKKLPEGHLAAFRSEEEYDFVKEITRYVY